ncbi:DUF4422 domain-containing protein [Pediococcus siamensis]|uniref:DUF4422 domain-containing protein n=1 Tax=Pediococcus siamensis TaxID=381829 RepID=UPI0039A22ABF
MEIKILVAAHKNFPMPKNRKLYLPVLVGATQNYKAGINFQRDDQGKNISIKNPNYNELTAVYWAWKNLSADAVGLVHYRRFLSLHKQRNIEKILNQEETEDLLNKKPIILPKKRNYYIETNYTHYMHAHHVEPLDITRQIILETYPDHIKSFDKVMNSRKAHMFNLFIMKKEYFDNYAYWLFTILFKLEKKIDIQDYSVQESRVFGYLSELLLDVWINKNNFEFSEVNWIQIGKRNLGKKILNFFKRKFFHSLKKHTLLKVMKI